MMMVQLNSDRISSTMTVILPSVVAFWMAYTAALAANMGWMNMGVMDDYLGSRFRGLDFGLLPGR